MPFPSTSVDLELLGQLQALLSLAEELDREEALLCVSQSTHPVL